MDKEQCEELMLNDQKIFARYAKLFMELQDTSPLGFLDWCWEKYREGTRRISTSRVFGGGFFPDGMGASV